MKGLKIMKAKMKKTISAALACVMLFSIGGCKKQKETVAEAFHYDGETFVPDKQLNVKVWSTHGTDGASSSTKIKNNVVEKWLEDTTRVTVDEVFGNGGGEWESALAKMIAGGTLPEIVSCSGGQGPTHFAKLAQADKIWELTPEMLQKYAPNVWNKIPQKYWERIKVDGKIYGVPYNFPTDTEFIPDMNDEEIEAFSGATKSNVTKCLWIRDDIAKMIYPDCKSYDELVALQKQKNTKIGDDIMDIQINSTDDLVNLLKKIKDLNLKEGSKTVYPTGYWGSDCWIPLAQFGSALMGHTNKNYITVWDRDKQEIFMPLLGEDMKRSAKLQNSLVREKIIDPESLINTQSIFDEKMNEGLYAVISMPYYAPTFNASLEAAGKTFRYRPLYTNVPVLKGYEQVNKPKTWGDCVGILKTIPEEDLPLLLNWMNVQFSDKWDEVRYWGPESAGLYEDLPDGGRRFKDEGLNKRFLEQDDTANKIEDCYGLQTHCGKFWMQFTYANHWHPQTYNHIKVFAYHTGSAFDFARDSKYVMNDLPDGPDDDIWSSTYSNIPEVQSFWNARSSWEPQFRETLAAASDEDFESKWQAAVENLKNTVDVEKMTSEMTKAAKESIK